MGSGGTFAQRLAHVCLVAGLVLGAALLLGARNHRTTETTNMRSASASAVSSCIGATATWTGTGDGRTWGDKNNWAGGSVPGTADKVCLPSGTPRIDLKTAVNVSWLVANRGLNVAAGLTLTDPLVVSRLNADSSWSSGQLSGRLDINAGVTLEILAQGTLDVGPGAKLINDGIIHLDPGSDWSHQTLLSLNCNSTGASPGTLVNNQGIELNGLTRLTPGYLCASLIPVLSNSASATITTGGFAYINVAINNQGIVDAGSNYLYITTDGPANPIIGTWRAGPQGYVDFRKTGNMVFNNPTLQGNTRLDNTTTSGTITAGTGATVCGCGGGIIQATIKGPGTFELNGGILDTDPTAGGPRTVYGGTLVNTRRIRAGVTLEILSQGTLDVAPGAKLINDGTVHVDPGSDYDHQTQLFFDCDSTGANPGTVLNHQRVELNSLTAVAPGYLCTSAIPVITNSAGATITAAGFAYVKVAVDNHGTVEATSGYLYITTDGPGIPIIGTWRDNTTQSYIDFRMSGNMAFNNPTLQGSTRLDSTTTSGTITADTGATVYGATGTIKATVNGPGAFQLSGASLDTDPTLGGPRTVSSGTLLNTRHINAGVTLEILSWGTLDVAPGAKLINDGIMHFDPGHDVYPYQQTQLSFDCNSSGANLGTLVNNQRIELNNQTTLAPGYLCISAIPVLTNQVGAIVSSAGLGHINVALDNHGTVEATSGYLYITTDKPGTPIIGTWRAGPQGYIDFRETGNMVFNNPTLQGNTGLDNNTTTGTIIVDTAATVCGCGGGTVQATINGPGTFLLNGGILDTDPTAGGPRTVYGGTLVNTRHINAGVTLEILSWGTLDVGPGAKLINDGILQFDSGQAVYPYHQTQLSLDCNTTGANPGTLVNNQRIELNNETRLAPGYLCTSAIPALTNSTGATINATGLTRIDVAVDNRGTVYVSGGPLELSARFNNNSIFDLAPGASLQLSGALFDNWQTVTFGDNANWWCSPSCNIVNEPSGTINLNGGDDFAIAPQFNNKGFIVFRGSTPREYHRTSLAGVTLGQGKIELSQPVWADTVHRFNWPAKPNDLPLPMSFQAVYGGCLNALAGLILQGVSANFCDVSHIAAGKTHSDSDGYAVTVGVGQVFGATLGVGVQFTPNVDSVLRLESWSYCFGADVPLDPLPFSGGFVVCKEINRDQAFPLGDDKDIMMTYVRTAATPYVVTGNLGLGWTISKKAPWTSDGYGAFFYTAVANHP
jgi:hypothetical protein